MNESVYYQRHLLLPEIGTCGQNKLRKSSVLVIGAGGLGCPILQYIAASGVGRIGIVDGDVVEESNLHRQILYGYSDLGKNKSEVAVTRLTALNPHITLEAYANLLDDGNAAQLIAGYDLVIDATDNFLAKYFINDFAYRANVPVVYGSINQFEGQVCVFGKICSGDEHLDINLRDIYPEPPPALLTENCAESGILGVLPGIVGSIQALIAIKILAGMGIAEEAGHLLFFDGLSVELHKLKICPREDNPLRTNTPVGYGSIRQCTLSEDSVITVELMSDLERFNINEYQVVDVRLIEEHNSMPVGECCIPLHELDKSLEKLDMTRKIIFVCKSGARAGKAVQHMKSVHEIEAFSMIVEELRVL